MILGIPERRSRPLTSIRSRLSTGKALPMVVLICSAELSPMSRSYHGTTVVYGSDEVAEHGFGDIKVGDHSIFHGTNGNYVTGCSAQHHFSLIANS